MTAYERTPSLRCRRGALSALVIAALLASMLTSLPAGGADGFSDVGSGSTHEPAIDALAEMGVFDDTECGDGLFCPGDPIDRWVMAVWLIRVLGGEVTTSTTSRFDDVDASEWWSTYAEELADRDITTGCKTDPLRYCPDDSVTRAQMATFFVRAFDLESASPAGFTDTGRQQAWGQHRRPRRGWHHDRMQDRPPPLLPRPTRLPGPDGHLPPPGTAQTEGADVRTHDDRTQRRRSRRRPDQHLHRRDRQPPFAVHRGQGRAVLVLGRVVTHLPEACSGGRAVRSQERQQGHRRRYRPEGMEQARQS